MEMGTIVICIPASGVSGIILHISVHTATGTPFVLINREEIEVTIMRILLVRKIS